MSILGIDLGTSSVKLLLRHHDGRIEKVRAAYTSKNIEGWLTALAEASRKLDLSSVDAIGFSGQVGTYVINGGEILEWSAPAGLRELREMKARYPQDIFLDEITMPHPDIVSYPIPRLKYIMNAYEKVSSICAPKDILVEFMTGKRITDIYSWRGLANLDTKQYSGFFLEQLGVRAESLPPLAGPSDLAGFVTPEAAQETGISAGTPVYLGCNDFFAGLAGSGIHKSGDLFDVTGTSEHIGGITDTPLRDAPPVSGKYFSGYVRYGVTASSGQSLDFGRKLYYGELNPENCLKFQPPLFLPYLNGERCPVCDPHARGVFFGMSASCTPEILAYSAMEGVVFNLKQILETLDITGERMVVSGGAAQSDILNQMKADILRIDIAALNEPDASALGAVMMAGIGCGIFADLSEAVMDCTGEARVFKSRDNYDYTDRFMMFKQLYPVLQQQFEQWGRITNQ